ncbi:MAG TPA: MBL fold metallo-hydrolase [Candidatus Paceibacterota bacterium]|nr:MBL fold metallo-hydrolase [Candidatus Paceibacterota bacterium]
MHFIMIFLAIFFGALLILIVFLTVMDHLLRSKKYNGAMSDHFDGKKFFNILADASQKLDIPEPGEDELLAEKNLLVRFRSLFDRSAWKMETVETSIPPKRVEGEELLVTFINHATVLIQTEGVNILTDPIYSYRASPLSFLGPRRYRNPGVRFEDLPPIDVVLISHNHYDHMDIPTLRKLHKVHDPKIYVPLGNVAYLEKRGISGAVDMDWKDGQVLESGMGIFAVPAQHFSARAISDRMNTLWAGFVIKTAHGNIYFAGDTGYGPWVEKVVACFPDGFRLALLPIGAFRPRVFFRDVHISPEEALLIQKKIRAQTAIGIHFGTFRLTADGQDEGAQIVRAKADPSTPFLALQNGEAYSVPGEVFPHGF